MKKENFICVALTFIIFISFFMCSTAHSDNKYVYDSRGKRDPFVPLVGFAPDQGYTSLEDIMSIEDVRLEGIASDTLGRNFAIINGEVLKEGQIVGQVKLQKVSKDGIILIIEGEEYEIEVSELEF